MASAVVDGLIESGRVPDWLLRRGIRANLATRLARDYHVVATDAVFLQRLS